MATGDDASSAPQPTYPFLLVDVAAPAADALSAQLFELGASGVEERDDQTLLRGPGGGRVTVVASFDDRADAEAALAALAEEGFEGRIEELVGDAWRDAWKEHFAPFELTQRIVVAPPWVEAPAVGEGQQVLWLEPGRAFGTGLHATTSLCAEALEAHAAELAGAEVCDVGTGSGILGLCALLLGAGRALCIDNDADVIEVVRENAARNGLAGRVEAAELTADRVGRAFPVVLANIETRVLLPIAAELRRLVAPGGLLVLSGILAAEEDVVCARYQEHGLACTGAARRSDRQPSADDWVALTFAAPAG
jgi:ribosomal protein L11 methyltransferase